MHVATTLKFQNTNNKLNKIKYANVANVNQNKFKFEVMPKPPFKKIDPRSELPNTNSKVPYIGGTSYNHHQLGATDRAAH